MEYAGGHRGYSIKRRPREYPRTKQQQKFVDALGFCGIKKGITKYELMEKMVNCIPEYFRREKEKRSNGDQDLHI
jgi:hypothetical protein